MPFSFAFFGISWNFSARFFADSLPCKRNAKDKILAIKNLFSYHLLQVQFLPEGIHCAWPFVTMKIGKDVFRKPQSSKNWITTWIFGKPRQRWPKVKAKSTPNPRPGQERPPHDFVPVQKLLVAWSQLTATHDVWWSQFIAILAHSWQILDIPADKSSDFINSSNSLVNISFFNRWSHCHFVISQRIWWILWFSTSPAIPWTPSCCHWNIVARSSSVLCCRRSSAFSCLALVTQKNRIYIHLHLTCGKN